MWLNRIESDRLRNLKAVALDLPAEMTLVAGRNAQGKTSLLESIYLLGTGRSFRTRRLEEVVSWDGGPLRVGGTVEGLRGRDQLSVVIDDGPRRLIANGGEVPLESFIGRLDVVDLNSERMSVLSGGPDERRRFLDRGIVGLDSSYLRSLGKYRRVMQQRNALLRRGEPDGIQLDVWDGRLVDAAEELHQRRREYAAILGSGLGEIGRVLFPTQGELRIRYQPSPSAAGEQDCARFREIFSRAVETGRPRDLLTRQTCRGPHRDDLIIELDGVDLRKFGSAGQLRASMIALKLSKLSLLRQERGESPLFLMDDFDSDLDERRAADLAGFLLRGGFQAIVATSKEGMAAGLGVSFMKVRLDDGVASA